MLYIRRVLLLLLLINKLLLWLSSLSLLDRAVLHHLWSWVLQLWWLVLVCVLGRLSRVHHLFLLLFQTSSSNRTWSHRTIIILILRGLLIHNIILDVRLRVILWAHGQAFGKLIARISIVVVFVSVATGKGRANSIGPVNPSLLLTVVCNLCLLHLCILAIVNRNGHIWVNRTFEYLWAFSWFEGNIATIGSAEAFSCRRGRAKPVKPLIAWFEVARLQARRCWQVVKH